MKPKAKKTVLQGKPLPDIYVALPDDGFRKVRPSKATKQRMVIEDVTAREIASGRPSTIFMGGGYPPPRKK